MSTASTRRILAAVLGITLVAAGCSSDSAPEAAPILDVLETSAGSLIGYETLADQVLDSDAVVEGPIVDVTIAGEEKIDDGSDEPLVFIHLHIKVERVIHQPPDAKPIEVGDVLLVETVKPFIYSLEQIRKTFDVEHDGLHLLFNVTRLEARLGMGDRGSDAWLYQTDDSAIIRTQRATETHVEHLPDIAEGDNFDDVLNRLDIIAEDIAEVPQPKEVIGRG